MKVKAAVSILILMFVFFVLNFGFAQEADQIKIKGAVEKIAEDGSYIIVNSQKISTTSEFLNDAYLEVGDNIEVVAEKSDQGLKIVSYEFTIDEEESGTSGEQSSSEKISSQKDEPAIDIKNKADKNN
jgi:hypothetical protein